jgi:hypothetical protein
MVDGRATRFSVWDGIEAEEEANRRWSSCGSFYRRQNTILGTNWSKERTPARERDEHVVVLSSRSGERMRTTPPSLIFHEGV